MDWIWNGGDRELVSKIFLELRNTETFKNRILSLAISNDHSIVSDIYDFDALNNYVNYFNIMSYGFTTLQLKTELGASMKNVITFLEKLLDAGIDRTKILLGLEWAGRKFNLIDQKENNLGSHCLDSGVRVTAFAIRKEISSRTWNTVDGENGDSAFSYSDNVWISHENEISMTKKTEYAYGNEYAGVKVAAVNEDVKDSPLLNAIKKILAEINE